MVHCVLEIFINELSFQHNVNSLFLSETQLKKGTYPFLEQFYLWTNPSKIFTMHGKFNFTHAHYSIFCLVFLKKKNDFMFFRFFLILKE